MAKFTVRVELDDTQHSEYERLNSAMDSRGFTHTVRIQGIEYYLPRGEYFFESQLSKREVYLEAKAAVDSLANMAGIVVTQASGGRHVGGLKRVRSADTTD
ncbi:hypothetical protein [Burkholderia diffusa]|uniref:hypothetical protein n=1 Tax=Burkholderia diffusa TaxID=488732 RepID=UPI0007546AAC|nr:hypothetical protein [Burkholderia diffusa]KVH45790.1 hypothetical protein WJ39_18535 [Burkholderia diffusa]